MSKRKKPRADARRPGLGTKIATVSAVIAATALLLANLETIMQTTRRLLGVAPPVVSARLVLEDVRIAPATDRWKIGQWHMTEIAAADYERESKASGDSDAGYAFIPGSIPPLRPGTCSITAGSAAQRRQAISTVSTDYDGLAPAGDSLRANGLGLLLYTAVWTYSDTVAAAGSRLLQRPMPEDRWDVIQWCGDLHRAVNDSAIVQPPIVQVTLRNTSPTRATIQRAEARPIRSYGGEAGGGGVAIKPVGTRTDLTITHEGPATTALKEPISLGGNETTMLEFGLHVADADPGDGPGELLFALVLHYFDGTSVRAVPVGNFILSDRVWDIDTSLGCGPMVRRC